MLRTVRIVLALLFLAAITLLFLDNTGFAAEYLGFTAKMQLVPALLSLNVIALAILAVLTIVLGRVYCSVICPLGVTQDIFTRIGTLFSGKLKRRIGRFKYSKEHKWLRYTVFTIFVVMLVLGLCNIIAASLAAVIEPYSIYGRCASGFYAPVYDWINNLLASYSESQGTYTFDYAHRTALPGIILAITGVSAAAIFIIAAITGREYCNSFCPVGTFLGFISRFAILHPVINNDLCNGCRSCERHCKAGCIDAKNHKIDMSRCVSCMDCMAVCTQKAISLGTGKNTPGIQGLKPVKPLPKADEKSLQTKASGKVGAEKSSHVDTSRRNFVTIVGLASGVALASAAGKINDGGLTPLTGKKSHTRKTPIVPPGSQGLSNVRSHCVGCQLCVQQCPQGIIKTSYDLDSFMQPYIDYKEGYCLPECTRCSDVCPAGVILPLDVAEKSATKIGTAVVNLYTCVSASGQDQCGNCARHCPAGAITMVPVSDKEDETRLMPVVDAEHCIGCGACEYHCPVGNVASTKDTQAAIHVEGIERQRVI